MKLKHSSCYALYTEPLRRHVVPSDCRCGRLTSLVLRNMALLWTMLAITVLLGGSNTRVCGKCSERQPEDTFKHNKCRKCRNKWALACKKKKSASTPLSVSKKYGRCHIKTADAFYKSSSATGGLQTQCKICQHARHRENQSRGVR